MSLSSPSEALLWEHKTQIGLGAFPERNVSTETGHTVIKMMRWRLKTDIT